MNRSNSYIRTILGDIQAKQLGLCYSHEHVVIEQSYPTVQNEQFLLNDVDKIIAELKDFHASGGCSMVDTMPCDAGRNVEKLVGISRQTNVHIIMPTGLHLEEYYLPNHWRYHYSEDQIATLFIKDIVEGVDKHDYNGPIVERTPYKAGLIKLATGDSTISSHQEKIFRAGVYAHLEAGAPILTHTNAGKLAFEQLNLFVKLGADISHVVISHADRHPDISYHRDLLQSGVCLEYDSAFRWKDGMPNGTYKLLEALLPEFPDQIVMGMDAAKRCYWKAYGGSPGLNFLLTDFKDWLQNVGYASYYEKLFYSTPSYLYAFLR